MVAGLLLAGGFTILPLALTGPLAFVVLRAATGLATAIYDPAARGYLTDATPPERRGEAFGLYGAAQMGGLLLGTGDRRVRRGPVRRDRVRLRLRRPRRDPGRDPDRAAVARDRGADASGVPPDGTEFPPDSPSIARRGGRRRSTTERDGRRPGRAADRGCSTAA